MNQRILAGDIEGASSFYASFLAENIRQSFFMQGTNSLIVATLLEPKIIPFFIGRDEAKYGFDEDVPEGTPKGAVEFVKENGVWKISDNH